MCPPCQSEREGIVQLPRYAEGRAPSRPAVSTGSTPPPLRPSSPAGAVPLPPCMPHAMGIIPKVKLWLRRVDCVARDGVASSPSLACSLTDADSHNLPRFVVISILNQISTRENSNIQKLGEGERGGGAGNSKTSGRAASWFYPKSDAKHKPRF